MVCFRNGYPIKKVIKLSYFQRVLLAVPDESPLFYCRDNILRGLHAIKLLIMHFPSRVCEHKRSQQSVCLTLRRLMSYIYGAPILDVSRSHTMTQHSR